MTGKDTRTEVTMIRWTKAEKAAAAKKARAKGLTLSAWLRMLAVTAAAVALLVGCGGDGGVLDHRAEGMWSSRGGALACVGAVPEPGANGRLTCLWACVEVDGRLYSIVFLSFVQQPGATEWQLESQQFVLNGTSGYASCQ